MSKAKESKEMNRKHSQDQASKQDAVNGQTEKRQPRTRLIPIWLRLVLLLVCAILALCIGAMIGYGVIGTGNPLDVFHVGTWKHIRDIVTKGT